MRPVGSPRMEVLVVIPTYDEIENIDDTLHRARAALPDGHVLVVDDGSPDGTADQVEKTARRELGNISVLRRPAKAGPGLGLPGRLPARPRRGVRRPDRDGRRPLARPGGAAPARRGARSGADLAIGSRYVPGGSIPDWPFLRRAISRLGCWYARVMLGLGVNDATAGFRAYRAGGAAGHRPRRGPRRRLRVPDRDGVPGRSATAAASSRCRSSSATARSGHSKMSGRIVVEALWLVTRWGVRDLVLGGRWRRARPRGGDARLVSLREWVVAGALVEAPEGLLVVRNVRRNGHTDWSTPGRSDRRRPTPPSSRDSRVRWRRRRGCASPSGKDRSTRSARWRRTSAGRCGRRSTARSRTRASSTIADPDGIVVEAAFLPHPRCIELLVAGARWVHEPLTEWLGRALGSRRRAWIPLRRARHAAGNR